MAPDELALKQMRERLTRLAEADRPVGLGALSIEGADVDMWEEEAHLVGIADSVLHGRQVDQFDLTLDDSIDARIHHARVQSPPDVRVDALLAYRAKIRALHASLVKVLRERR